MRLKAVILFLMIFGSIMAQETLTLFECQKQAIENAPRLKDRELVRQIGELKVEQAGTSWYPSLNLNGKASYQSDVVTVALADPNVPVGFAEVPHDQYGLNLDVTQNLYDGGISKQKKTYEQAAADADLQQVEVDLYGLKGKVNQYYFAVLALQENQENLDIHEKNLTSRLEVVKTAVEQGTMVEAELKIIQVEILKVKQSMVEVDSRKKSYMGALKVLCGDHIHIGMVLEKPYFEQYQGQQVARPEHLLFDLKDASMEAGKDLISKKRMPVVYAFGQTGYGKPGYNMLSGSWDFYYMLGAGLRWNIWDRNTSNRGRQVIEQQQNILQNQRATFDQEIESLSVQEEAEIEHFRKSMELEKEVLELQQDISEYAALKLENGTITATEYVIELNKESTARINLSTHQVMLMQSIANYLTIQGNL